MTKKIPYIDRKHQVSDELIKCSRRQETITYGELGDRVDVPARGPWKKLLDHIGQEETSVGRPDITYLVVKGSTGYPSQIAFQSAESPTPEQKDHADRVMRSVFAYYADPVPGMNCQPGTCVLAKRT